MAFGLGFYIMLHTDTDPNKMGAIDPASDYYFFDSPWLALVKTATMFVGEIEFAGTEQDYRVTMVVAYLGWVDYDFGHSSLSAWFCLGRWEFGRIGWSTGQGGVERQQ